MSGFPLPPESRLEALLGEAFEFMPGPDMQRLAEIEARVLRGARGPAKSRRAGLPWWALLLLAGGTATAAWWAAERLGERNVRDARSGAEMGIVVPGADAVPPGSRKSTLAPPEAEAAAEEKQRDTRIIYEREAP